MGLSAERFNPLAVRILMEKELSRLDWIPCHAQGKDPESSQSAQGTPGRVWGDGGRSLRALLVLLGQKEAAERPNQASFLPVNQPEAKGKHRKGFP